MSLSIETPDQSCRRSVAMPSCTEPGDLFHPNDQMDLGAPAAYEIKDGQIVTTLDNTPFAVTVYKVGEKYVAARSNEFGYANYEVEQIEDSGVTTGVIPMPR